MGRAEFQGLINWCEQPVPPRIPHLKWLVATYVTYTDGGPRGSITWTAKLPYRPGGARIVGSFGGTLYEAGTGEDGVNPIEFYLAFNDLRQWVGVRGGDFGAQWGEDVELRVDPDWAGPHNLTGMAFAEGDDWHLDVNLVASSAGGGD